MHACTVIKEKVQSLCAERNKYDFKRDLNDDSDGAHLTPFEIEFQTEEESKENSDHQVLTYCVQVNLEEAWCMS